MLIDDAGIYNDYKLTGNSQPLSVLIDRDMTIHSRGTGGGGHYDAASRIPDLL